MKLFKCLLELLFVFIFLLHGSLLFGQENEKKVYREIQIHLLNDEFSYAIPLYEYLIEINPYNFDYNYELALLYFQTLNKKAQAVSYFEQARNIMTQDSIPELYVLLAQAYQAKGLYEKAIETYNFYQNIDSNFLKVSVTPYIEACELGIQYQKNKASHIEIINLGEKVNSNFPEYVAVPISENELFFTTRRFKNAYDELIEAIYYVDLNTTRPPVKLDSSELFQNLVIDPNEFQSVVSLSPDKEQLITYFDPHLYISTKQDGFWTKPNKMSAKINFGYSTKHASMTKDNSRIYFSSLGKRNSVNTDLYFIEKLNDGSWSKPQALDEINTLGREDAPFITENGAKLYFSSNGYPGMGGFDVYKTVLTDTGWSAPKNLGAPINSAGNDIYFILDAKLESGYISSDRTGGYGEMDIYQVKIDEIKTKQLFDTCYPARPGRYPITFDATASIDPLGAPMIFEWEMGDGNSLKGKKVQHVYKKPGAYKVFLHTIDSLTGMRTFKVDSFLVEITNVDYQNFEMDTMAFSNEDVLVGAEYTSVKDAPIISYDWLINDTILQGKHQTVRFKNAGNYKIKLRIRYRKNDKKYAQCFDKSIAIVNKK